MNPYYCSPNQFYPGCGKKRKIYTVAVASKLVRLKSLRLCAACLKKHGLRVEKCT